MAMFPTIKFFFKFVFYIFKNFKFTDILWEFVTKNTKNKNMLANRLKVIRPSPTLTLTKIISELKSKGEDIIDFGVGEPSFQTPSHVCEAGINAISSGQTKYTAVDGTKSLREAISKKLKKENNLYYPVEEIIVGTGAKQVIFNAMMATLNPSDEVVIPSPYWVSYPDMVQLAEGTPIIIPCEQKDDFKLTPEKLKSAISQKTKWLILNSPSNPTGMVYTKNELFELSQILIKNPHVWLLSDDIYEHLIYDSLEFHTMLNLAPELRHRTLIVNGLSKSHAMTGWRLGYGAGPQELIKNMSKIQSHSTSNTSSISQYAAETALNHDMEFFREWKEKYIIRRDLAIGILSKSKLLNIKKPNGAFYIFINCQNTIGKSTPNDKLIENDTDLAEYLLRNGKVGVVQGEAFGLSPYFRISYVANEDTVKEGCERIMRALDKLC